MRLLIAEEVSTLHEHTTMLHFTYIACRISL